MLLYRSLEHYIYDTLRHYDAQTLGNEFGKRLFEKYVGKAARHTGLPVVNEQDLLDTLGQNGKLVDYLIIDSGAHIFIDAKAVEMTYIGEVSEETGLIIPRIESSVIKGIRQAYSLAERLEAINNIGSLPLGQPTERHLLIVTYKDMYLGCGRDFYHYIAKEKLDEIAEKHGGRNWIPFEHIYVVSIEDFDLFAQAVREGRIGMAECLRRAVAEDSTPFFDHRNLVFRMHLHQMIGDLAAPPYLDQEFDEMIAHMRSKFPK